MSCSKLFVSAFNSKKLLYCKNIWNRGLKNKFLFHIKKTFPEIYKLPQEPERPSNVKKIRKALWHFPNCRSLFKKVKVYPKSFVAARVNITVSTYSSSRKLLGVIVTGSSTLHVSSERLQPSPESLAASQKCSGLLGKPASLEQLKQIYESLSSLLSCIVP